MPHLMKRMQHLIKDNKKKLSTTWYIVIYTIQTITILSQQNKRHWNLFKQYIIFKKTIYSNCCQWFKKSDFKANTTLK